MPSSLSPSAFSSPRSPSSWFPSSPFSPAPICPTRPARRPRSPTAGGDALGEKRRWIRDRGGRRESQERPAGGSELSDPERFAREPWRHLPKLLRSRSASFSPLQGEREDMAAHPAFAWLRERTRKPFGFPQHGGVEERSAQAARKALLMNSLFYEVNRDARATAERSGESAPREISQEPEGDSESELKQPSSLAVPPQSPSGRSGLSPSPSPCALSSSPSVARIPDPPDRRPDFPALSSSIPGLPAALPGDCQVTPMRETILETVEGTLLSSLTTLLRLLHPQLLEEANGTAAALLRRQQRPPAELMETAGGEDLADGRRAATGNAPERPSQSFSSTVEDGDRSGSIVEKEREVEGEPEHEGRLQAAENSNESRPQGESGAEVRQLPGVLPSPPRFDDSASIAPADPPLFLLCCSGGSDSTALLHAFARLFSPRAIALRQAFLRDPSALSPRELHSPPEKLSRLRSSPVEQEEPREALDGRGATPPEDSASSAPSASHSPSSAPFPLWFPASGADSPVAQVPQSGASSALESSLRNAGERAAGGNRDRMLPAAAGALTLPIHVVYFDHAQRPEAAQKEAASVRRLCEFYGFPFHRCALIRKPPEDQSHDGKAEDQEGDREEAHAQKGEEARVDEKLQLCEEIVRGESDVRGLERCGLQGTRQIPEETGAGVTLGAASSLASILSPSPSSLAASSCASSVSPPPSGHATFAATSPFASFSWSFPLPASAAREAPQRAFREWRRRASAALLSLLSSLRLRDLQELQKHNEERLSDETHTTHDGDRHPETSGRVRDSTEGAITPPSARPLLSPEDECWIQGAKTHRSGARSLFGPFVSPSLLSQLRDATGAPSAAAGHAVSGTASTDSLRASFPLSLLPSSRVSSQPEKAGTKGDDSRREDEDAKSCRDAKAAEAQEGSGKDRQKGKDTLDLEKADRKECAACRGETEEGRDVTKEENVRSDERASRARDSGEPRAYVVMAHHAGDELETLVMKLLRGSHLTNLGGMSTVSPLSSRTPRFAVFRPFLSLQKAHLQRYVKALGGTWREDETNAMPTKYPRNAVRLRLLPLLASFFASSAADPASPPPLVSFSASRSGSRAPRASALFPVSRVLSPFALSAPRRSSASGSLAPPRLSSASPASSPNPQGDAVRYSALLAAKRAASVALSLLGQPRDRAQGAGASMAAAASPPGREEDSPSEKKGGRSRGGTDGARSSPAADWSAYESRDEAQSVDAHPTLMALAEAAANIFFNGPEPTRSHALLRRASSLARQSAALREWVGREATKWERRVFSGEAWRREEASPSAEDSREGSTEAEEKQTGGKPATHAEKQRANEEADVHAKRATAALAGAREAGEAESESACFVSETVPSGVAGNGRDVFAEDAGNSQPFPLALWQKEEARFFQQELLHRWLVRASEEQLGLSYAALEDLTNALLALRPTGRGKKGRGRDKEAMGKAGTATEGGGEEREAKQRNEEEGREGKTEERRDEEREGEGGREARDEGGEADERAQRAEAEEKREGVGRASEASSAPVDSSAAGVDEEGREGNVSAREETREKKTRREERERGQAPELTHKENEREGKKKKTCSWQVHLPGPFTLKERGGFLFLVKGVEKS
ncbi:conserved hypothetical protein [Neospora caninum Liverpool]|uniref:PP-loop family protein n=1 Tax=Neospora caninum (strain Liverpool) TaxID=572307 RepID=F0VL33_NEOCL|nr:conserved hypothetical protein [Neospora caninum Liverpool]CBZ54785.1 conserved hypothetical protein [Neospora caninum Liverpool]CEL69502.1 TPA: PP-loop family protein [Neospora caninum Liverpool]|eukprot:XP_003884813.1 conserved hypothetical protein [Neospora caninum Liverpool]